MESSIMTEFLEACYDAIKIQGESISRTIKDVEKDSLSFSDRRKVIFVGCGDSFAVARYGQWVFLQSGVNANALSSPDITRVPLDERDVVIGVTASGRSIATIDALEYSKQRGAYTVVLTDDLNGKAGRNADLAWQTHACVDSYNISPSSPTTTAMAYILKRVTMENRISDTEIHRDSVRLEKIGKKMVEWAEVSGTAISKLVDLRTPLYFVSDGPNHIAAHIGLMKFNEYSLVKAHLAHREEYSHHWNLSLNEGDSVVFVTDSPPTTEDSMYLKILNETLRMKAYHLYTDNELDLESPFGQTIANTIALQMAAYYTVTRFEPHKDKWKQPNADAFNIY
jgi:glucosamine 6-phosphate synthetase-like amidotransferase/phosphosugar isomerase protein